MDSISIVDYIGYIGSILISITFIPQIVHTYKIKDSSGISKPFIFINMIGTVCMLIYGVYENLVPVIISNSLILFLLLLLTFLICIYRNREISISEK